MGHCKDLDGEPETRPRVGESGRRATAARYSQTVAEFILFGAQRVLLDDTLGTARLDSTIRYSVDSC